MNNIVITARECTRAITEERLSHSSATGVRRLVTQAVVAVEVMRVRTCVCVCKSVLGEGERLYLHGTCAKSLGM